MKYCLVLLCLVLLPITVVVATLITTVEASHSTTSASHSTITSRIDDDIYHLKHWVRAPTGLAVGYLLMVLISYGIIACFEEFSTDHRIEFSTDHPRRYTIFEYKHRWGAAAVWPLTVPLIVVAVLFRTQRSIIRTFKHGLPIRVWFRSADEFMHQEEMNALKRLGGPQP